MSSGQPAVMKDTIICWSDGQSLVKPFYTQDVEVILISLLALGESHGCVYFIRTLSTSSGNESRNFGSTVQFE